jgi:class 3 adenylate cyclase/predicted ATPase
MRCSSCNFENAAGKKFCIRCGAAFGVRCPKCNCENPPEASFCGDCGASLEKGSAADERGPSPGFAAQSQTPAIPIQPEVADVSKIPDGERKTVTALFADIKGSTELIERLDPEEARALIDPVLRLMIEAVHRYEGYVAQSTGDGIFALFGAPTAYEDHPQRALHAALAMQQAIRDHASRLGARGCPAIEARVGVSSGEVVVRTIETGGRSEYTPIGMTTNLAARLQTVASAGLIAVSDTIRRLCEGYFSFRGLGPVKMKGVVEPVEVYEVTGVGPLRTHFQLAARRGLTQFMGRERELAELKRALDLARSGHGQIVAAVAEAGTGKSRLVHEFKAILPPECKVLEAYSVSHGKEAAWLPVLELLRGYFCVRDADEPPARREKVRTTLSALDPTLGDTLSYLLGLLGIQDAPDPLAQMDPQIRRRRTLEAIGQIILRESLKHPLVVIFEDLHWVDEQTQALLDLLVDSIAGARVLLLANYRPEYRHQWSGKGHYTQLRLDPLGGESAAAMLTALLGDGAGLANVKRLIAERTGGNPFFIEEMAQALFDEGALVRNGAVRVVRPLSQLRLPATVQGILASRIDRLVAEQKDLLQTLAVIGRESPVSLIRKMVDKPKAQLDSMLMDLRAAEFIYEQPALTDSTYVFKHALTQEVAYDSLLMERRKILHERAGAALETLFGEQLDHHLGELARHYSRSGNVGKAIEYLGKAGRQALQRCSYVDAIKYVSNALERLKNFDEDAERAEQELPLQITFGASVMATQGWAVPEVGKAFSRAQELCRRIGDAPQLVPVLFGIWGFYLVRGELQKALQVGKQLWTVSQKTRNPMYVVAAGYALGVTFYWIGDLQASEQYFDNSIHHYDPVQHRTMASLFGLDPGIVGLAYCSLSLCLLGFPDRALERMKKAERLAPESGHSESLAWTLLCGAIVHQIRRDSGQAGAAIKEVSSVSVANGLAMQPAIAKLLNGWVLAVEGDPPAGCSEIRAGFQAFSATGEVLMEAHGHAMLAEAYWYAGSTEDGLLSMKEPLTATKSEEQNFEAELCRLRGELLCSLTKNVNRIAEIEALFQQAIDISQTQNAKTFELRATRSLARLLATQGRRDEARTMLADVYGWFTEGFDTADLKDAKALLDELSRQ